jgi:putative oxidoreductase
MAAVVALVELACGAAVVLGFCTRWVSIPLALGMAVDTLLIHGPQGFAVYQGGYEYALLRLAATVALIFTGSGRVALDNILASRGRSVLSYLQRKS